MALEVLGGSAMCGTTSLVYCLIASFALSSMLPQCLLFSQYFDSLANTLSSGHWSVLAARDACTQLCEAFGETPTNAQKSRVNGPGLANIFSLQM